MLVRALHLLPPEAAHRLAIRALGRGLVRGRPADAWPTLATTLCGLELPNPLGIAAGFNKNAQALPGFAKMDFGWRTTVRSDLRGSSVAFLRNHRA